MLAKLIRRGWAVRPPVIADIFVLSEDNITPRSVAPGPSCVCKKIQWKVTIKIRHNLPAYSTLYHRKAIQCMSS
jgi:hypothetical protein